MDPYIHLIEELSLNAWPAWKSQLYDSWIIRFSKHYTHRTNCVNIVAPSTLPIEEKISYCEHEYATMGSPCIFKIGPAQFPSFDHILESKSYHIERKTQVMVMPISSFIPFTNTSTNIQIILEDIITDNWIHNLFHLNGTTDPSHLEIVPSMFKAIPRDTIVAKILIDGRFVASGLGIIERNHVGLYAIYVDHNYRKQNLGKIICSEIIQKARSKNVTNAYLQVVSDNQIAKYLYEGLGFMPLYTYWFRSNSNSTI